MASTTITHNRVGYASKVASTQAGARGATTGDSATNSPTSNDLDTVKFQRASTGRGTQYQYIRTYIYFDLSTISYTSLNSLQLQFTTGLSGTNSGEFIACRSNAFGGDGSSALTVSEYGSVFFGTNYSPFKSTLPANVSSTLDFNASAISDAETNDYLILALINYDYDYVNTSATSDLLERHYFNYSTSGTFQLFVDYNAAPSGPTGVGKWDGVLGASIQTMNTVTYTDINKINGV